MLKTAHFVPLENNVGGRYRTPVNVSQKANILNDACIVFYGDKI